MKQRLISTPPVAAVGEDLWASVDRGLFERLRGLRRTIAEERSVPAFVVFGDATLRDLARLRPRTKEALRGVKGVGDQKAAIREGMDPDEAVREAQAILDSQKGK